jgi:hypothetical protein
MRPIGLEEYLELTTQSLLPRVGHDDDDDDDDDNDNNNDHDDDDNDAQV